MNQRLPAPPSVKSRQLSTKRIGPEVVLRRSNSQVQTKDNKMISNEKKILDYSGRIQDIELPLPLGLQVLDLSDNADLPVDFIFDFNIPNLQTLRLNHCNLENLPSKVPHFAKTLRTFTLDGNLLKLIPEWVFTMPELNELSLYGNEIESIELPNNEHLIKILNLSFNPLVEIRTVNDELCNIQLINLTQTLLTSIPTLAMSSLKTLCLARCQIKGHLDDEVYSELASLDVSYNKIESLSDKFTNSCRNLNNLNLSNNFLTELPESFVCPANLTKINLANNMLTSIPTAFMSSTTAVEQLNFASNKLTKLEPFHFRQLRNLNVCNNQLTELPDCLDCSLYLTVLNIAFNRISDLPHSLASCRELSELNCTSNQFTHIPQVVFALGAIRVLSFSGNTLTTIPDSLSALLKLSLFDLSNNNLTTVPSFVQRLSELRALSLSHNRIKEVTGISFPPRIQSLDLSFNCIENLSLDSITSLLNLALQYNNLKSIPPLSNFPSLQFFSIAGNDIVDSQIDLVENCTAEIEIFGNNTSDNNIEISQKGKAHFASIVPSSRYGIGIASSLGLRQTMEDAFTISSTDTSDLFLIFDGHAGSTAARLLSDFMTTSIEQIQNSDNYSRAIIETLIKGNEIIRSKQIIDGSTVAGTFVSDNVAYVVGIGDSRVLSVSKSGFRQLTEDQKPTNASEYDRLKKAGFHISSEGRIGRKLAVARSLGDFWCHDDGLFVEPEISIVPLNVEEDVGIVIACDGLWDMITNEIAADVVRKSETAVDAAIALKNLAIATGSQDNVSVIVVLWKPKSGDEGLSKRNTVAELPPYIEEVVEAPTAMTQLPVRNRRRR